MAIKIRKSFLAAVAVGSGLAFASTGMAAEANAQQVPAPMIAALQQPYPPAPIDCPQAGNDVVACVQISNNNTNENDNEADADAVAVSVQEEEFNNALTSNDPDLAPLSDFGNIESFPSAQEMGTQSSPTQTGILGNDGGNSGGLWSDHDDDEEKGDDEGTEDDGEDSSSNQDKHFTIDTGDFDKNFDDDFDKDFDDHDWGHGWWDKGGCVEGFCEKKKELPKTGASVQPIALTGAGLLLAGVAGTLAAMRRRRSTDAK